jgi:hypothetical protein
MQHYWSDNQVSCTAEFDPETEAAELERVLESYESRLKAISFLPADGHDYEQPPYEAISREVYREMVDQLEPIEGEPDFHEPPRFCSGDCNT